MEWIDVLMLFVAGSAAGFVGGLLGVGGGLIFTPVLFFHFESIGIPAEHVAPLSIGTGLLCTMVVAASSAISHWSRGAVDLRTAAYCGLAGMLVTVSMATLIATSVWYTPQVYRFVFSAFLLIVAVKMIRQSVGDKKEKALRQRRSEAVDDDMGAEKQPARGYAALMLGGSLAGFIASSVGVGGGIILVPMYDRFFGLPVRRAMGTSSATIVLITLAGIIGFVLSGASITATSVGHIEFARAIILVVPATITARTGVRLAHRTNTNRLRVVFALLAMLVAILLLSRASGIL